MHLRARTTGIFEEGMEDMVVEQVLKVAVAAITVMGAPGHLKRGMQKTYNSIHDVRYMPFPVIGYINVKM